MSTFTIVLTVVYLIFRIFLCDNSKTTSTRGLDESGAS